MQNVREWLDRLGLGEYAEAFEQQRVKLELLHDLTDQDLKEIGVVALGDRKLLLKAIAELGAGQVSVAPAAAPQVPSSALHDTAERRQITVLFSDLVGYTALASRLDPEALRQVVREYEDLCASAIARFDGYVFQRLGDGIVAYFGFPLAHEGEAERAILAAQAIIDVLATNASPTREPLQVRIGIATGMVVIESAGDQSAVGETMNLAARLQSLATPGNVLVADRTRALAAGSFEYEDMGPQTLKGLPQPVRVWRVLRRAVHATRYDAATADSRTPLVGREQELALLVERWQRTREDEGQLILLGGEPGIGKSRLLSALRDRLGGAIGHRLIYQCSPFFTGSSLHPFLDPLPRELQFQRDESPESKLDKMEAWVTHEHGQSMLLAQLLSQSLGLPAGNRYPALNTSPQRQKDDLLHGMVRLLDAIARRRPTLMVVEDAHWADPTSLELLELLVQRLRDMPLLLIITHRPEFTPPWRERPHALPLALTRLSRAQMLAMTGRLTGNRALPPAIEQHIRDKTDGVPLFVEELIKALLESDLLKLTGERYELQGSIDSLSIPATLRDSLVARLDRLGKVKEIAQIGAALGREFNHDLLAALVPMGSSELDGCLARLIDAGLIFKRATELDRQYVFKHALVQDAAYESMLMSARRLLHSRIAGALEEKFPTIAQTQPEVLAHHQYRAGEVKAAIASWQRAARLALERVAINEAINLLEHALAATHEFIDASSDEGKRTEVEIRLALGTAWTALSGWGGSQVLNHLQAAHDLGLEWAAGNGKFLIFWGIGTKHLIDGKVVDAIRWANESLRHAAAQTSGTAIVLAHAATACHNVFAGNYLQGARHARIALSHHRDEDSAEQEMLTNHNGKITAQVYLSHALWATGMLEQALATMNEQQTLARERGHPFQLGFSLGFGSQLLYYLDNCDRLLALADECQRIGEDNGLPFFSELDAVSHRAHVCLIQGQFEESLRHFDRMFALPFFPLLLRPFHRCAVARAQTQLNRHTEALATIEDALQQIEQPGWGEGMHHAEALRVKAWILWRMGQSREAEQILRRSMQVAQTQEARFYELRSAVTLAEMLVQLRRQDEAKALLAPLYEWFTEGLTVPDLCKARSLLGNL